MNPGIRQYLDENGATYTPEALRKGLLDAGYDPAEIDAAMREWQARRTGGIGSDDVRTFGRWAILLHLGALVATFVLLLFLKGVGQAGVLLVGVGVLAVAMLIGWAISSMIGRALLRGGTIVALIVPAISALLLGGSCFAMLNSVISAPPREGTLDLEVSAPFSFDGSGAAECYVGDGTVQVNSRDLGTLERRALYVYLSWYPEDPGAPGPAGGTQISISRASNSDTETPESWSTSPDTQLVVEASADGLIGTAVFEDLAPEVEFPDAEVPDPMSGSVSWTCE
ncbi:MAG TPA: hypothetical protein VFJ00_02520 [Candidatus Limnocylindria bacterium]|nr:hypothetical protein [Candidatus Limnocylindria bacterium]